MSDWYIWLIQVGLGCIGFLKEAKKFESKSKKTNKL